MADSSQTYGELTLQLSQLELAAVQPLITAYTALQEAASTAATALTGGTGTTTAQMFVRNAVNNTTALLQQGNSILQTLQASVAEATSSSTDSSSGSGTSTNTSSSSTTPTNGTATTTQSSSTSGASS